MCIISIGFGRTLMKKFANECLQVANMTYTDINLARRSRTEVSLGHSHHNMDIDSSAWNIHK